MSMQYLFYLIYNSFYSYNILTILSNLKFKFNHDKKDIWFLINQYIFIIHYLFIISLTENPEMDNFEEENKLWF